MNKTPLLLAILLSFGTRSRVQAQISHGDSLIALAMLARTHSAFSVTMPYRLFVPAGYTPTRRYPLVMFLHGGGEAGTDNLKQVLVHPGATVWARDSNQAKVKCFVLAPQMQGTWANWLGTGPRFITTPETNNMKAAESIIDSLKKEFSIDSNRVYVTGMSQGGTGTWDAIERHPNTLAAAGPMCAPGDSTLAVYNGMKDIPVWIFASKDDGTTLVSAANLMPDSYVRHGSPVTRTNLLADQITDVGLADNGVKWDSVMRTNPKTLYSLYLQGGHVGAWRYQPSAGIPLPAFRGYDNPYFINWLLSQSKPASTPVRPHARAAFRAPAFASFAEFYSISGRLAGNVRGSVAVDRSNSVMKKSRPR